MLRKLSLVAIAAASLGTAALAPTSASAWGGWHGGWHGWGGPRIVNKNTKKEMKNAMAWLSVSWVSFTRTTRTVSAGRGWSSNIDHGSPPCCEKVISKEHRGRYPGLWLSATYSCGTALDLHQLPNSQSRTGSE